MGKHADKIAALRADEEGKEIQFRSDKESRWLTTPGPMWNFDIREYREKPFEPEVDKVYLFSDDGVGWFVRRLTELDEGNLGGYIYWGDNVGWKFCRLLTEDEIGK